MICPVLVRGRRTSLPKSWLVFGRGTKHGMLMVPCVEIITFSSRYPWQTTILCAPNERQDQGNLGQKGVPDKHKSRFSRHKGPWLTMALWQLQSNQRSEYALLTIKNEISHTSYCCYCVFLLFCPLKLFLERFWRFYSTKGGKIPLPSIFHILRNLP